MTDATTLATFMDGVITRPERTTNRYQIIRRLYLAYFDRAPDMSDLAYWEQALAGGTSIYSTSAFFAQSKEFTTTYGGLSNAGFVQLIYQNVLDRNAANDPGAAYWTNELDQGKRTRGNVMVGFSESAEGKAQRAGDVAVADLWAIMMDEHASDDLMAVYGRHILAGGTTGSLATMFLVLGQYNP